MIRCIFVSNVNVKHFLAVGVSDSELPVEDLDTGSVCYMADTKKLYVFHSGTGKWYEQPMGTSTGGGGKDGKDGKDGYTPVRGVDYWTDEDIAVIKSYVETAIEEGQW